MVSVQDHCPLCKDRYFVSALPKTPPFLLLTSKSPGTVFCQRIGNCDSQNIKIRTGARAGGQEIEVNQRGLAVKCSCCRVKSSDPNTEGTRQGSTHRCNSSSEQDRGPLTDVTTVLRKVEAGRYLRLFGFQSN